MVQIVFAHVYKWKMRPFNDSSIIKKCQCCIFEILSFHLFTDALHCFIVSFLLISLCSFYFFLFNNFRLGLFLPLYFFKCILHLKQNTFLFYIFFTYVKNFYILHIIWKLSTFQCKNWLIQTYILLQLLL
jgi:hypothetical protein